jgi:hypothetical protein
LLYPRVKITLSEAFKDSGCPLPNMRPKWR